MATEFYMTLPSNASMKLHPDNTLAHYITALPQRIDLSCEWDAGWQRYNTRILDTTSQRKMSGSSSTRTILRVESRVRSYPLGITTIR